MRESRFFLLALVFFSNLTYSQLKIYCLDVNQGDATLIILPDRRTLLIDAGLKKDADEILETLQRENIGQIDFAILTHFDRDHRGGFSLFRDKNVQIKTPVCDHGGRGPKKYQEDVKERRKISPGDTVRLGQEVIVVCLAGQKDEKGLCCATK